MNVSEEQVLLQIAQETFKLSQALTRYLDFISKVCGVDAREAIEPFDSDGFEQDRISEVGKGKPI